MAKMRVLRGLWLFFPLCCFAAVAFGSSVSNHGSGCSFSCGDFRAHELRNREQGKFIEELKAEMKSLRNEFAQLKSEILSDHGAWLLTPPLRGPPGKQGPKGEIGATGQTGAKGDRGLSAPGSITSCSVAMEILPSPRSAKQSIYPHENTKKVEVLCDFQVDGGGWTLIQKRLSGPQEEFNRNWDEYSTGFGSLDGNFWLGLENIHALTKNGDQELRIELEDFQGNKKYAKYSNFSISDASDFYRLAISGFSGDSTAGDSMMNPGPYGPHDILNGMRFSTEDKDNDLANGSCVNGFGGGGWWFNNCGISHLNRSYRQKGETHGITWFSWNNSWKSLRKTEMKIRTKK